MSHAFLRDRSFYEFLAQLDERLAEETRAAGCRRCGGRLHAAFYFRRPRGIAVRRALRFSFCCSTDGCRRRHAAPSVLFLGRKVFAAAMVVLASAMRHGLPPRSVEELSDVLEVSERTLVRWRRWWLRKFAPSRFWQSARGRLPSTVSRERLPASLLEVFAGGVIDQLHRTLRFLAPVSTSAGLSALAR